LSNIIVENQNHNIQEKMNLHIKMTAQETSSSVIAGWVSFGQKWKTIFCRHYRFVFTHCDIISLQSKRIRRNNAK